MEDLRIQQWTHGNYLSSVESTKSYQDDMKTTKSGPDIRLTELEQQLEVAETRCGSLKSQLDYMKILYQGVQPCSPELIETTEGKEETSLLPQQTADQSDIAAKESSQSKPVEYIKKNENCEKENSASEDVKYYQFLEEIHRMHEMTKEDAERTSPKQSSRSSKTTPRIIEQNSVALEQEHDSISAEYRHVKQIHKTYTLLGPAAEEASPEPFSLPTAPTSLQKSEVCKEHDKDDATAVRHPYQYFTEESTCLENKLAIASYLMSQPVSENKYELEGKSGLSRREERTTKRHDLVLKLTESVDSTPVTALPATVKRKKILKLDKKQKLGTSLSSGVKKNSNLKYDDSFSMTSKSKRKKGKPRGAYSKNTVMTKATNLSDIKDSKKRKNKGYSLATRVLHHHQPPAPYGKTEIVEIYHNNAVEGGSGSVSVSSSKQLKQEAHCQQQRKNALPEEENLIEMSFDEKCQDQLAQQQQKQQQQQHPSCIFGKNVPEEQNETGTLVRSNNQRFQKGSSRSHQKSQNNYTVQDSNEKTARRCSSAQHSLGCYDPTITRNYELPTVASKLKKVNRSYFNRFNFRNIPFVVGTSVTPSHNLGLNIQQVLSIMKTRQPMATRITPSLIRKMSKGIQPVSALLHRINVDSCDIKSLRGSVLDKQPENVSCGRPNTTTGCTESFNENVYKLKYTPRHEHSFAQKNTNFNEGKLQDRFLKEEEEQESGCICCPKKSKSYNKMLQQYISRKSIAGNLALTASTLLKERQEEINIGDNQYNEIKNVSGNAKGIREVLINLHDQFEELNSAYEKLQVKAAKAANNISITKQAAALEKELNAKEDEINALVGLYKEVLQLKQQVNSINGKNSFVCITTGGNLSSPLIVPRSGVTRAQVTNPMEIFGINSNRPMPSIREPATATRLAGLLREIQSFQKQLLAL